MTILDSKTNYSISLLLKKGNKSIYIENVLKVCTLKGCFFVLSKVSVLYYLVIRLFCNKDNNNYSNISDVHNPD